VTSPKAWFCRTVAKAAPISAWVAAERETVRLRRGSSLDWAHPNLDARWQGDGLGRVLSLEIRQTLRRRRQRELQLGAALAKSEQGVENGYLASQMR
jgi:hypothetical protein